MVLVFSIIMLIGFIIFSIVPGCCGVIVIPIIVTPFTLICFFTCFYSFKKEIIVVKDVKNNLLNIKEKNYLCCKKKYKFSLENSAFFCEEVKDEGGAIIGLDIAIINLLKNKNEIDLDNSTIKEVPLKYIFFFHNLKLVQNLEMKLNNYINSPGYINHAPDEYKEYLYRYKKYKFSSSRNKKRLDNFLKISDFFIVILV